MRPLALVVLVLAATGLAPACSNHPERPPVETLYRIQGADIVCDGTAEQSGSPAAGPYTVYTCSWSNVRVAGDPKCWAVAVFERPSPVDDWHLREIVGVEECG